MQNNNMQSQQEFKSPAPVVQEQDFPQKSSRLQELMSNYRKDNNLEPPVVKDNPLAKVKVSNEVKTRKFDDLSPADQSRVLEMVSKIDYTVSSDIQTFGSAKESPMTKHAEIIISKYSASEVGAISDPMTDLVATLKSNSPQEVVKNASVDSSKEWGFFDSLREVFSMKKARKKMYKALAEHDTIMKNIQAIEVELKKQQLSLQKDIKVYEEMGRDTYVQISDFELYCIALNLMIDDAKCKLQPYLEKETLDLMESNEANTLQSAIERMQRRLYAIQTIRTSTVQTVPQLAVLIYGDEIICEKIDEVSSLVIPMWEWQYAIAIGALKQQEALSIQKTIRGITSKLITGNAKMLHDNMIAAQEELYAAAVAIEDLCIVQDYIDDMYIKVHEVRKESSAKYVEGMKTMQQIEKKNIALMQKSIENQ